VFVQCLSTAATAHSPPARPSQSVRVLPVSCSGGSSDPPAGDGRECLCHPRAARALLFAVVVQILPSSQHEYINAYDTDTGAKPSASPRPVRRSHRRPIPNRPRQNQNRSGAGSSPYSRGAIGASPAPNRTEFHPSLYVLESTHPQGQQHTRQSRLLRLRDRAAWFLLYGHLCSCCVHRYRCLNEEASFTTSLDEVSGV